MNILNSETIRFIKKRNDPCDCKPPWLACCGAARPEPGGDPGSTGCSCDDEARDVAPEPARVGSCVPCQNAAPKNCRKHCCYRFSRSHLKGTVCLCNKVGTTDPKTGKMIRECKMCHCVGELHPRARGCSPLHNEQLSSLTLLQQTANHLGLIIPDQKETDPLKRKEAKTLARTAFKGHEALLKAKNLFVEMSNPAICCKMKV